MAATRAAMSLLMAARSPSVSVVSSLAPPMPAFRSISSSSRTTTQEETVSSVASTSTKSPPAISLPSPFEPALTHPRTHNHHVASLHLRAHGPGETLQNLQFFSDFALRAGYALGIPLSKTAFLPTRISLWTVPKGPFVHKKSQENFQRRVHKRVIKVWDSDIEVVDKWLQFLRIHCMDGVGMRAEIYRNFPLSIGSTLLAASTSQLRSIPQDLQSGDDATLRASEADSDQVARLARTIIENEVAKQDEEDSAEKYQQLGESRDVEVTPKDEQSSLTVEDDVQSKEEDGNGVPVQDKGAQKDAESK